MSLSIQSLHLERLGIDERLELVEEILASLADNAGTHPLSDAQRVELDRRLTAHEQNPDDVIPLSAVMTAVTSRLKG